MFRFFGFGSFHTLVFEVTRDPAMLDFLDLKLSTKTKPNENYGRELMELFVLGVKDMNGVDNYTQDDVEQITKALTGWQIISDAGVFTDSRHDHGNKTLFAGKTCQQGPADLGVVDAASALLPPATNVIDVLLAHRDTRRQAHDAALHRQEALGVVRVPEPVEDARRRDHGRTSSRTRRPIRRVSSSATSSARSSCTTSSTARRRRPRR